MRILTYNRYAAFQYAKIWALKRNSNYYNFDNLGGDCTNFVSQCIFAGSSVMNYTPILGWYYKNLNDRTPSWTGVEFLYNFLANNVDVGPFGKIVNYKDITVGDVIFLRNVDNDLYHTLFVNDAKNGEIFVSSHTADSFDRSLFSYPLYKPVFFHIEGVRDY